jgi:hypothetical protein
MVQHEGATSQAMPRLNDGPFGDNRMPLISRKNQKLPLVDKRGRLNVEIRGLPKTFLYWGDLFHTLVNVSKALLLRVPQPFSLNFSTYTSAIFPLIPVSRDFYYYYCCSPGHEFLNTGVILDGFFADAQF